MWYGQEIEDCIKELKARVDGLTEKEVWERLKEFGPNRLEEIKRPSPIEIFFG
jgi:magnesium-transporting ATPase (P-type)